MTALMSDQRHEELVKAAEECIDLMNIGAEPNAALRHVKKAFGMNDNEVILVSHAVNNSKQLSHLQTAKDKGAPFPLTNAGQVTGVNSEADLDTKAENTEAKAAQPDAVEIQARIKKEAAAASCVIKGDYRKQAFDVEEAKAILLGAWGPPKPPMEVTDLSNPFDCVNELKIAAEQARTEAVRIRDQACANLDAVARAFTVAGGPSFAVFEKAATAAGVTPELIDIVYDLGPATLEQPRNLDKTASDRLYVTQDIMDLLESMSQADAQWKQAADYEAARAHLLDRIHRAEAKVANIDLMKSIEELKGLPDVTKAVLPLDPETSKELGSLKPTGGSDTDVLGYKVQQQMVNSKARSEIESLLQDDFIGKHTLPDVVESYNRAMSVNPRFGFAETMAFVRQDLASSKAMPLDLLIRASNAHVQRGNTGDVRE